jgi:hypothetical protein
LHLDSLLAARNFGEHASERPYLQLDRQLYDYDHDHIARTG